MDCTVRDGQADWIIVVILLDIDGSERDVANALGLALYLPWDS
jgi:hypothetical protein